MNNTLSINRPLCLGYVRVSTDRQDLSVEAQTATINRAATFHNLPATEFFFEPDTSGSLPFAERPEGSKLLQRVLEAHSQGQAAVVIVPKVDRLGRDTIDVSSTARHLEQCGARLIFLDINVDTRTPMGRAFMQIAAVFAELELARIRERIVTALDTKRAKGLLTGTVPYGWTAVETGETSANGVKQRRLEPNPEEQRWILHMATLRAAGWSYSKIASDLNARHVPTKHGRGDIMNLRHGERGASKKFTRGTWQFGQVAKLLNSRTVREWLSSRSGDSAQAA